MHAARLIALYRRLPAGFAALACVAGLAACQSPSPELTHSPEFAPAYPVAVVNQRPATGAIYNGRQSDNWFGRGRSYSIGDIITVLVEEQTQAARQLSSDLKREASNDVVPSGLVSKLAGAALPFKVAGTDLAGSMNGLQLNSAKIASKGTGQADQSVSVNGAVSVTVVEVLNNGNLLVRGEKKLALTEGSEVIQISGIIRPEDISPNNTVQSRRLANAQIAYRGTGDMANNARAGWGTSLLWKIWPF